MKNYNFQKITGVIICLLTIMALFRVLANPDVFGPFFSVLNDLRVLTPLLLFFVPGITLLVTKRNVSVFKSIMLLVLAIIMGVIFSGSFSGFAPTPVIIDILLLPFYLILAVIITLTSRKMI